MPLCTLGWTRILPRLVLLIIFSWMFSKNNIYYAMAFFLQTVRCVFVYYFLSSSPCSFGAFSRSLTPVSWNKQNLNEQLPTSHPSKFKKTFKSVQSRKQVPDFEIEIWPCPSLQCAPLVARCSRLEFDSCPKRKFCPAYESAKEDWKWWKK